MRQTRLGSFVEAWVNILIGFGIAMAANAIVLPAFGFNISPAQNFWITCIFTAISLVRSYVLRRFFNSLRLFHRDTKAKG
jgi:hypothetical protein